MTEKSHTLKHRKNDWKGSFTVRTVEQWSRLSREAVQSPALEAFKVLSKWRLFKIQTLSSLG